MSGTVVGCGPSREKPKVVTNSLLVVLVESLCLLEVGGAVGLGMKPFEPMITTDSGSEGVSGEPKGFNKPLSGELGRGMISVALTISSDVASGGTGSA